MRKLSKNEWVAVGAALIFVAYAFFGGNIMDLFRNNMTNEDSLANVSNLQGAAGGVVINDLVTGQGREAKNGDTLSVHYILSLSDGTTIQNSRDFGVPFQFSLGAGQVISGWEQGFEGMKVGGVRTIIVPPELGYGPNQAGPIPPNSTLVFTVELIDVQDAPQAVAQ